MTVVINGTTGISGVDGSAGTPAVQGTDTNTGVFYPAADTVAVSTGGSERMRIDSSGNVGIGTSSPTEKCHIYASSGNAFYRFQNAATGSGASDGGFVGIGGSGDVYLYNYEASNTIFATNNSEKMRIDTSGNLMVGTTSALNGALLTVQNSGGSGIATGYGTTAGQWRRMYINTSNQGLYFYNGNNEGYLSSAGAWTNASDARLKKNIRTIEYGLDCVLQAQPRHFERNDVDGTYIGFVAQELQEVVPEVVSGDPERQLGVDYGSLVAVAFKAIQEQQALITALTARITVLENK